MPGIKCCYQCHNRYTGCHSECEKYISEKRQLEEDKEKLKEHLENIGSTDKHAYDVNFYMVKVDANVNFFLYIFLSL